MLAKTQSTSMTRVLNTIRWFSLACLIILNSIFPGDLVGNQSGFIFLFFALWLAATEILGIYDITFRFHSQAAIILDLVFAIGIFLATGAFSGSMLLAGFLPVLTVGLSFGFIGSLPVSIFILIFHALAGYFFQPFSEYAVDLIVDITAVSIINVLFYFFSSQIVQLLRSKEFLTLAQKQEREKKIRDRVYALDNLTSMIYSTLNFDRLLDISLDMSMKALSDPDDELSPLVGAFLLIENGKFIIGSSRRFTQADVRVVLQGEEGILHQTITSREQLITTDFHKDKDMSRILALMNCKSICCSPLASGYDVYGALLFGHPEKDFFGDFQSTIIEVVSRLVIVAIENAKLYSDLEDEKQRMIELQDETQKKLARDLHDGPTQTVAAIAMRVNFTRRLIEREMIQEAAEELFKIEDLSRRSTKEIRHMLFTLRPLILESNGLIAALQSLAEKMGETYDQNVLVQAEERTIEHLEINKQGILFYIVEEAVNNARKHAEASEIIIRISPPRNDIILVEVRDNGVGFNVGAIDRNYENRGSLGMVNLKERTELLNGLLRIDSAEGEGTRVKVWIPLSEEAKEKLRKQI